MCDTWNLIRHLDLDLIRRWLPYTCSDHYTQVQSTVRETERRGGGVPRVNYNNNNNITELAVHTGPH